MCRLGSCTQRVHQPVQCWQHRRVHLGVERGRTFTYLITRLQHVYTSPDRLDHVARRLRFVCPSLGDSIEFVVIGAGAMG